MSLGVLAGCALALIATCAVSAEPDTYSGGDGSSMDNAVVIHAKTDRDGTHAEYAWLHEFHPGYKLIKQSLVSAGGRKVDVLEITDEDGKPRTYYFDISESFGKF